ncbi:Internalin-like protein [Winogradskyella psychrotolerans RS-3]|uniref:Internalin-like protein n=1 Tax=Winogradskyella psychrotolerans RS-3 TaxID=641526 RepID=S7X585_9FLAO|nr:T9SS type A sorting domain-containing protein [Winogradskyella psychrotolerans]EPR74189.1 Internalin-like protein [Winogradskyella psychrotolerans RS-3]
MKTKLLLLLAVFSFLNMQAQQCTTSFNQGTGSLSPNYSCGQGFIAQCDGALEYVQFLAASAGTIPAGTLKIFSGNQVSGSPIYTQSHPAITVSQANDPIRVDITGVVNMVNNVQYTFEITINNVDILFDFAGGYSGGTFFQSDNGTIIPQPNFDLNFDVSIAEPCTVNIPDANFKAALVAQPTINTNGNTEIECSEATAFTGQIYLYNESISDLTGIEAFVNVTNLYCAFNTLTSLDLSNNIALEELYCHSNAITNLDLSANTALYKLNCSSNALTSLNIANGNNASFTGSNDFIASNNPNLTCIQIDAGFTPPTTWQKDATASYSDDCAALSVDDFNINSISLHPNPTTSILNIEMNQEFKQATIYSVLGKEVLKTQHKNIDVSGLTKGLFLIKIEDENGNVLTKRFIKQ